MNRRKWNMFYLIQRWKCWKKRKARERSKASAKKWSSWKFVINWFVQWIDANTVPQSQNPFAPYMNAAPAPAPAPPTFVLLDELIL